jgi:2-polyprenyl-3-methyl-5-hydroxy-6-metoxy-1,4-benzoquinol methylase
MKALSHFHETDPSGLQTLERFARATHFNKWLFDTISPWCKGPVLEVGSGIGNISSFFLKKEISLTASDLRDEYCNILHQKFGKDPYLQDIKSINLTEKDFDTKYASLLGHFNTVVALNVIEHIEDDTLAVANCKRLLSPGGNLVVLVPAYKTLYNLFDEELGHFVRYTSKTLQQLLKDGGFQVIHKQYFNAAGIAGWMINGSLFRKKIIPKRQLQLFDKLIPVMKLADAITFHRIGLSVIAIGQKAG